MACLGELLFFIVSQEEVSTCLFQNKLALPRVSSVWQCLATLSHQILFHMRASCAQRAYKRLRLFDLNNHANKVGKGTLAPGMASTIKKWSWSSGGWQHCWLEWHRERHGLCLAMCDSVNGWDCAGTYIFTIAHHWVQYYYHWQSIPFASLCQDNLMTALSHETLFVCLYLYAKLAIPRMLPQIQLSSKASFWRATEILKYGPSTQLNWCDKICAIGENCLECSNTHWERWRI